MVVDEYGRSVGLVTVEDLLEEIVGELREEREPRGLPYLARLPDGAYVIDGTASIHDLRLQARLPLEESPEYQTIAGYLLHALEGRSDPAFGPLESVEALRAGEMARPPSSRMKGLQSSGAPAPPADKTRELKTPTRDVRCGPTSADVTGVEPADHHVG